MPRFDIKSYIIKELKEAAFTAVIMALYCFFLIIGDSEHRDTVERRPAITGQIDKIRRPDLPSTMRVRSDPNQNSASNSTGTMLAVNNQGVWLTAFHVVDDCKRLFLIDSYDQTKLGHYAVRQGSTEKLRIISAQRTNRIPHMDVALVISAMTSSNPLTISDSIDTGFEYGDIAFAVGYPQSKAGEMIVNYLGNSRIIGDDSDIDQPVTYWAITEKSFSGTKFSGISGGPLLNKEGDVIGIALSGEQRRGRMSSAMPSTLRNFIEEKTLPYDNGPPLEHVSFSENNYMQKALELRKKRAIAQALCLNQNSPLSY
jgi:serine protease Do